MKNKEIEELLNKAKNIAKYGADGKQHTRMFNQFEAKALLSYIGQLEKENDRLKEVVENLTTMIVNGDTQQIKNTAQYKLEQLENNRDKAIEVIDLITPELWNISNAMTYKLKDIKYILKGGSDE